MVQLWILPIKSFLSQEQSPGTFIFFFLFFNPWSKNVQSHLPFLKKYNILLHPWDYLNFFKKSISEFSQARETLWEEVTLRRGDIECVCGGLLSAVQHILGTQAACLATVGMFLSTSD